MANEITSKATDKRSPLIPLHLWESNEVVYNPVDAEDLPARKVTRARIYELEDALAASVGAGNLREERGALKHHFLPGVYARELAIPAETIIVSKLHKLPRLCVISKGEVSFTTEFGTKRVIAPYSEVFPAGSKVALFTHTDVVWTTIHATDGLKSESDLDELEGLLIAENHEEYDTYYLNKELTSGEES